MAYAAHDLTEKNKPQSNLQTDEIDLAKLFGVLWRGKLWIILCGVLAVIAGAYYVFGIATPVYTTSTKVALESRQEQIIDNKSVVSGMSGDQVAINGSLFRVSDGEEVARASSQRRRWSPRRGRCGATQSASSPSPGA